MDWIRRIVVSLLGNSFLFKIFPHIEFIYGNISLQKMNSTYKGHFLRKYYSRRYRKDISKVLNFLPQYTPTVNTEV